jgi:hypothetical protein
VAVAASQLAQRVEDVDVEPHVRVRQAVAPCTRVEQDGDRPVDVARGLGDHRQTTG